MSRFSSDSVVICYLVPVMWMTSSFRVMGFMIRRTFLSGQSVTARNYGINSNQILLNGKNQQAHIMGCAPGTNSAVYDCLVDVANDGADSRVRPEEAQTTTKSVTSCGGLDSVTQSSCTTKYSADNEQLYTGPHTDNIHGRNHTHRRALLYTYCC